MFQNISSFGDQCQDIKLNYYFTIVIYKFISARAKVACSVSLGAVSFEQLIAINSLNAQYWF